VSARLEYHFDRRDAELAQNGEQVSIDRPTPGRRRPLAYETAPSSADIGVAKNCAAAQPRKFATVLVGCGDLLQEWLQSILDKSDFQVAASAVGLDELALIDARQLQIALLIVDGHHDVEATSTQVQLIKQLHADARVAVLTETDRMADLATLFQAGADACFAKGATPEIFLKCVELVMPEEESPGYGQAPR
jgi:CheY-like chemotaxis protein